MVCTKALDATFYIDVIDKNMLKDIKERMIDYQFGERSNLPEKVRQDNIRNIKAQLWEWGVSKKEFEKI